MQSLCTEYAHQMELKINGSLPVTANRAPNALMSVRTNVIPRYPVIEKMNANPYAWVGFYETNK